MSKQIVLSLTLGMAVLYCDGGLPQASKIVKIDQASGRLNLVTYNEKGATRFRGDVPFAATLTNECWSMPERVEVHITADHTQGAGTQGAAG